MMHRAWELRRESTPAERKLWARLRAFKEGGIHFRRQHAIGPYVADFCAPGQHLIVELDGSQHLQQEERDVERTAYLQAQGYRVIRFWTGQVMNDMRGVLEAIEAALK